MSERRIGDPRNLRGWRLRFNELCAEVAYRLEVHAYDVRDGVLDKVIPGEGRVRPWQYEHEVRSVDQLAKTPLVAAVRRMEIGVPNDTYYRMVRRSQDARISTPLRRMDTTEKERAVQSLGAYVINAHTDAPDVSRADIVDALMDVGREETQHEPWQEYVLPGAPHEWQYLPFAHMQRILALENEERTGLRGFSVQREVRRARDLRGVISLKHTPGDGWTKVRGESREAYFKIERKVGEAFNADAIAALFSETLAGLGENPPPELRVIETVDGKGIHDNLIEVHSKLAISEEMLRQEREKREHAEHKLTVAFRFLEDVHAGLPLDSKLLAALLALLGERGK